MQNTKATIVLDGTKYIREDLAAVDSRPITERVKSYEDACAILGFSETADIGISAGSERGNSIIAYAKLLVIAEALNEGWTPDWNNSSQYKYYPWFKASGSGLSFSGYDFWSSYSCVPARLCFKSEELAKYAGTQFIDLYTDFIK